MTDKVAKNSEHPNLNVGRKKGAVNKSTKVAREAFAELVDGNSSNLNEWLSMVAYGVPLLDRDGNPVYKDDVQLFRVPPSPKDAIDLVQKIAEYHIPKLARTELVGDADQPVVHKVYKWKD